MTPLHRRRPAVEHQIPEVRQQIG